MCRWFAYISPTEDILLEDVLVSPAHALSKQVHDHYLPKLLSQDPKVHAEPTTEAEITTRNRLFNVDGFGMAWYTPSYSLFTAPIGAKDAAHPATSGPILHPALYKNIQPPINDRNFRSICISTASRCILAHIRAATATAITPVNNHPFTFGRHTIMHNGYISDFTKIARQMANLMSAEAYENISGSTDTEHLAALYMTYLTGFAGAGKNAWEISYTKEQMLEALEHTANTIIDLQQKTLGDKAAPNDLNVCVTDGTKLVAIRFRNHATEQPPSLYFSESAGVTLNRKYPDHPDGAKGGDGPATDANHKGSKGEKAEGHNPHAQKAASAHGKHVIVASEPTTYKDHEWTLIEKNYAIMVDEAGNVESKKVAYNGKEAK